jgi:hypothetical protein
MTSETATIEAPAAPTTTPTAHKRKAPAPINQKYLDEITLIRRILPQAQKPEHAELLTAAEWPAERIAGLGTKATALETAAYAAVGRTQARKMNTEEEQAARRQLLGAMHPIRVGAKRKYRNVPDAEGGRATFFVNESTGVSLERLLFMAGSMLQKLNPGPGGEPPEETLSGVTSGILRTLATTRGSYITADALQQETENQKNQAHTDVVTAHVAAQQERIDLQLAADQTWTFHNPANSAIRRAFDIPPDRPASE